MKYQCIGCGKEFTRESSFKRHFFSAKKCTSDRTVLYKLIKENKTLKKITEELTKKISELEQKQVIIYGNNNNVNNTINITLVNSIREIDKSTITKKQIYDATIKDDYTQSVLNVFNLLFHNPTIPQNHVIKKAGNDRLKIYEKGKWRKKKISDVSQSIVNEVADTYDETWCKSNSVIKEDGFLDKSNTAQNIINFSDEFDSTINSKYYIKKVEKILLDDMI